MLSLVGLKEDETFFEFMLWKFGLRKRYKEESLSSWLWDHVSWVLGRRKLTFWWQRRTRGFDDSELWSLDTTMCRWMAPRIRALSTKLHGYPTDFLYTSDEEYEKFSSLSREEQKKLEDKAFEDWKEALNKMAKSMEVWGGEDSIIDFDTPEGKEVLEGFELFHKHFFSLWD